MRYQHQKLTNKWTGFLRILLQLINLNVTPVSSATHSHSDDLNIEISDTAVNPTNRTRALGVIINAKLNFNYHITEM